MLFGYAAAVVAGFLLTAVPNWTGRLPLQGRPLTILFSVWVIGRIAVSSSAWLGWAPAMIIDAAFLVLLAAAARAQKSSQGKKWGQLQCRPHRQPVRRRQSGVSSEAHYSGSADYATRAGIALVIILITLIGGRIIPSFTRNWLAKRKPGPMPAPFLDASTSLPLRQAPSCLRCGSPGRLMQRPARCCFCAAACTLFGWRAGAATGHLRTVWC